jgi:tripartite-type tricarboxylate transporter receptor subunit TctC
MKKIVVFLFALFATTTALAEEPITIVVPFPPGSNTDSWARYNAKALVENGIPAVVINRPGAGGTIAIRAVAEAKNKNSMLLTTSSGAVVGNLMAPESQQTNLLKDLDPITLMTVDSMVVVVPANSPYKNLKDLIADIKRRPGEVKFGQHTQTSALFVNYFMQKVNGKILAVPYNGTGPNNIALLGNQVDFALISYGDGKELYEAGKFRYLGVATKSRLPFSAEIPTLSEQGIKITEDDNAVVFIGVYAPAGMDPALQARINKIITSNVKADRYTYAPFRTVTVVASTAQEFKTYTQRYQEFFTRPGGLMDLYYKTNPKP